MYIIYIICLMCHAESMWALTVTKISNYGRILVNT